MNRVLLVSVSFPPMLGGGVLRPSRLALYLPEWGWECSVLTRSTGEGDTLGEPAERYAQRVTRAPRLEPTDLYGALAWVLKRIRATRGHLEPTTGAPADGPTRRRLVDYLFVPDTRILWVPGAVVAGMRAVWRDRAKIIYSTSPDPSAHLVGLLLSMATRLPWIAEFRDPWITNPFRTRRPSKHLEAFERWMERLVVTSADRIIVTSEQYKEDFIQRYPQLATDDVDYIPNGFDPADFESVTPKKFKRVALVHPGNFYEARSSAPVLEALHQTVSNDPALRKKVELVFVGNVDPAGQQVIRERGLEDVVTLKGALPHRDAIAYTCGADALLLVPGPGPGTMPGKLFEYIAAQRPIFAIVSEGPAYNIVLDHQLGVVADEGDAVGLATSLGVFLRRLVAGRIQYPNVRALLHTYDRRNIAGAVAAHLTDLAESG